VNPESRAQLLQIARAALAEVITTGAQTDWGAAGADLGSGFGAFVSLHTGDWSIRGCVGCLSSDDPLATVVADMAQAAGTRDPRFTPVAAAELDDLIIEISVLTPNEEIGSLAEVEIGRDGLLAVGRGKRGVLLPQVAAERGWDVETFAEQTCVKAGLSPDAWREDDVQLLKFSAEVFSERRGRPAPS